MYIGLAFFCFVKDNANDSFKLCNTNFQNIYLLLPLDLPQQFEPASDHFISGLNLKNVG